MKPHNHLEGLEDAQLLHVADAAVDDVHPSAAGVIGGVRRPQLRHQLRRVQPCSGEYEQRLLLSAHLENTGAALAVTGVRRVQPRHRQVQPCSNVL